jgi:hypothetical protein
MSENQLTRYKKARLGQRIFEASRLPGAFRQVYVVYGGTGAVGGTAIMKMLEMLEEMMHYTHPSPADTPTILVTGLTKEEIRAFSSRLFQYYETLYGKDYLPKHISNKGYRTCSGIMIELHRLSVNPELAGLANLSRLSKLERQTIASKFLEAGNLTLESNEKDKFEYLAKSIKENLKQPFTEFLQNYKLDRNLPDKMRFRAVIVGIPLASVAAYHLSNLEEICRAFDIKAQNLITDLKQLYLCKVRDDLAFIRDTLAEEVIAAHTTAVGGMYDEGANGERVIRLGFAHSALDERLRYKQLFAEQLHHLYAEVGIKMLVTAAAIGIDAIISNQTVPIQSGVLRDLREVCANNHQIIPEEDLRRGKIKIYPPVLIRDRGENDGKISFQKGAEFIPRIQIRSGENGRFSTSNTDALYRVMRVASASELGLVLAEAAVVGDDKDVPWFINNTSYYTETENARLVFDFLGQPQLLETQTSGLDVKSFQDLGSAKHQGELHLLGLIILLHRLRTFDADSIPTQVSLSTFNARQFFENHSRTLFFEDLITWELESLCKDLVTLVKAQVPEDLKSIKRLSSGNYQERNDAFSLVMTEVIKYVHTITSLGSPIIFSDKNESFILVGHYIAPLDILMTNRNSIENSILGQLKAISGVRTKEVTLVKEYFYCNNGFIDLRPIAVISTARNLSEALRNKIHVYHSAEGLRKHLRSLPPYSYFATSGLVAFLERMRGLYSQISQYSLELGTLNDYRAQIPLSPGGLHYVVPGVVEALRQASEGLEKNTGTDRLHGQWGYFRREPMERPSEHNSKNLR